MTVKQIIVEWSPKPIEVDVSSSLPIVVAVQAVGAAGVKGDPGAAADHGLLAGLGDDDHTQYHTDARGDARYYTKSQTDTALAGKSNTGHGHIINDVPGLQAALDGKQSSLGFTPENSANRNAANGYAGLDGSGKVAAAQLPSFVDDVIEAANFAALPGTGEAGKIYVTLDDGKTYRWGGSAYTEISASPGSTDAVPEGVANLYHTAGRVSALISAAVGSVTQAYSATLSALAGLSTTAFGRSLLELASAAALRTAVALPTVTTEGRLARYTDAAGAQAQTAGLYEDASGKVGIGTTDLSYAVLTAKSSSASYYAMRLEATAAANGRAGLYLVSNTDAAAKQGYFSLDSAGNFVFGNVSAGRMYFDGYAGFTFREVGAGYATRMVIDPGGNVGIGTASPTTKLDNAGDTYRQRTARTPASATAAGNVGDHCWDANYEYRCVAANTWQRIARATW